MKRYSCFMNQICKLISRLVIFAFLVVIADSCNRISKSSSPGTIASSENRYHPELSKWVNWNVLFTSTTNESRRNQTMDSIEKYVTDYMTNHGMTFPVSQFFFSCPCDPGLVNFTVTPLGASGSAPVPPPPPGKGVGGSGDGVEYVNQNNLFSIDSIYQNGKLPDTSMVILNTSSVDNTKTLAVMDTGLDSVYYQNHFQQLLWSDPSGAQNIRNFQFFMNGQPFDYFWDDDKYKHGTAVTGLALQALEKFNNQNRVKPRVMILKVLDDKRAGSTFTVSCALSYVIQHQATIVNASLGYYGIMDSILLKYADRTISDVQNPIPVFAAAGNLPGDHKGTQLCFNPSNGNELKPGRLFYPACFSTSHPNFITVTGLSDSLNSCFYQNYSNVFVNVGVVTNPGTVNCCKFLVRFSDSGYEGSSFATPILSGEIMGCLLTIPGSTIQSCLDLISPAKSPVPNNAVTNQGRFLTYTTP
jgi:hypothetical protein